MFPATLLDMLAYYRSRMSLEVAEYCLFNEDFGRKYSGVAEFCLFNEFHLTEVFFSIRTWITYMYRLYVDIVT